MDEKKFNYRYQAPTRSERREIEDIRRRYGEERAPKSQLEELRLLDRRVKRVPALVAYLLGVAGVLIFGLGLAMILEWDIWVWGAVVACAGCVPMALAYPVHGKLLACNKRKYGKRILALSDALLSGENAE